MARNKKPSDYKPPEKTVRSIFYEEERYIKSTELVKKYATGYCIDQRKFNSGSVVIEKWQVGTELILILCEYISAQRKWRVEVFHPVSNGMTWDELDKALAAIAEQTAKKE